MRAPAFLWVHRVAVGPGSKRLKLAEIQKLFAAETMCRRSAARVTAAAKIVAGVTNFMLSNL